jgi:hypothetical protein
MTCPNGVQCSDEDTTRFLMLALMAAAGPVRSLWTGSTGPTGSIRGWMGAATAATVATAWGWIPPDARTRASWTG